MPSQTCNLAITLELSANLIRIVYHIFDLFDEKSNLFLTKTHGLIHKGGVYIPNLRGLGFDTEI